MTRLGSNGWWPFVGFFLIGLPLALGHFGFGCHRTDPGVTTDPGVPTEAQTNYTALSSEPPANSGMPSVALAVPILGGLAATGLRLRRRE